MIEVVTGRDEICKKIAEALGIEHARVLDFHMAVDDIVTVKVEFSPGRAKLMNIPELLEEYYLVKKEAAKIEG